MPKIGDTVLIMGNNSGHNYVIGRKYVLCSNAGGYWQAYDPVMMWYGNNMQLNDFKVANKINLKNLEEEEKELESMISKSKYILKYLEDNDKSECLDSELTASYLLSLIESDEPNKKEELLKILNNLNNTVKIDYVKYH